MESEKVEEIVRRYEVGESGKKIAAEMGLGETTVYRYLERRGVKRNQKGGGRWRLTEKQRSEAVRLFDEGMSAAEISRRFGCFRATVTDELKRQGRTMRGRGGSFRDVDDDVKKKMVQLHDEGRSIEFIMREVGLSRKNTRRVLAESGRESSWSAKREKHGSWRGGRYIHSQTGYIIVNLDMDDPLFEMANGSGQAMEHRLEMARHLGRPLYPHETVHHIDGDRTNNAIENLQLRIGKHGKGVTYRCMCCGSDKVEPVEI